jgi:hypothetical protein
MFGKLFNAALLFAAGIGLGALKSSAAEVTRGSQMEISQDVQQFLGTSEYQNQKISGFDSSANFPAPDSLRLIGPPQTRMDLPAIPTTQQLELVPLPPPFWTGLSGLLGLGFYRVVHNIRKNIR